VAYRPSGAGKYGYVQPPPVQCQIGGRQPYSIVRNIPDVISRRTVGTREFLFCKGRTSKSPTVVLAETTQVAFTDRGLEYLQELVVKRSPRS
jgi:hypothetical protein